MMQHNPSKPRLILPRVAERRKTTYLNGPPFVDDEGLVLVDRRSNEDRRGKLRNRSDSDRQVCALLRFRTKDPDDLK